MENRYRELLKKVLQQSKLNDDCSNPDDLTPLELEIAEALGINVDVPSVGVHFTFTPKLTVPIKQFADMLDEKKKPFKVKLYMNGNLLHETDDLDIVFFS